MTSRNAAYIAQQAAERREDLAWMAATGETTEGAAARLGITADALERWCLKHAHQTWRALRANDETYGRTA